MGNFTSGDLTQNWDKNGKIYYTNKAGQPVNMKIPTSEYLKNQAKAFATNTNNWINETNPSSEAYKQKLYLTSLLASAPLSLSTGVTEKIGQALLPLLGQRISQMTAQGLSNGVTSGALSGFAKGLIYNQNPFLTSAQDAALFSILGGGGNLALGNIEKAIMQYQIYPSPLKEVLIDNYIKNYVKGLDNITNELYKIRAMRVGTPPWQNTATNISYDLKPLKYTGKYVRLDGVTYKEIWLPKDEYARVHSDFTTYIMQNNYKESTLQRLYGNYIYTAIIEDGLPVIVNKIILKGLE